MKKYKAEIRGNTYPVRRDLRRMGFSYYAKAYKWTCILPENEVKKVRSFCDKHDLKLKLSDPAQSRSTAYRGSFFENHPGLYGNGEYYRCVYCGRIFPRSEITVDHLYSVGSASASEKLRKRMLREGIENVNDFDNLVPACRGCNAKKAASTGRWILKGKLGRHEWYWVVRKFLAATLVVAAALIFLKLFLR